MDYKRADNCNQKFMGLDNKVCEDPKYFCKSHCVYLSDVDVQKHRCLCKPTFDMISTNVCKSLITTEDYIKENEEHKERMKKVKNQF